MYWATLFCCVSLRVDYMSHGDDYRKFAIDVKEPGEHAGGCLDHLLAEASAHTGNDGADKKNT